MKTKSNFALRQVAGTWVVLPLGAATAEVSGMITLNESGVMLWKLLEKGTTCQELADALVSEYEVTVEEAFNDANAFLEQLKKIHCIEE